MSLHARITRRQKGNLDVPNLPAADEALMSVRAASVPGPPLACLSSPPVSA